MTDVQQRINEYWGMRASSYDNSPGHGFEHHEQRRGWLSALSMLLPPPPADVPDVSSRTGAMALLATCARANLFALSAGIVVLTTACSSPAQVPDISPPATAPATAVTQTSAYPRSAVDGFQTSCRDGGHNASQCQCAIDWFQRTINFDVFEMLIKDTTGFVSSALAQCANGTPTPGTQAAARDAISVSSAYVLAPQGDDSIYLYFRVTNRSDQPDVLEWVTSPVSGMVMVDGKARNNGVTRTSSGMLVPANGQAEFRPDGLRWMLMELTGPHAIGDHVTATLHFGRAGDVQITAPIVAAPPGG